MRAESLPSPLKSFTRLPNGSRGDAVKATAIWGASRLQHRLVGLQINTTTHPWSGLQNHSSASFCRPGEAAGVTEPISPQHSERCGCYGDRGVLSPSAFYWWGSHYFGGSWRVVGRAALRAPATARGLSLHSQVRVSSKSELSQPGFLSSLLPRTEGWAFSSPCEGPLCFGQRA